MCFIHTKLASVFSPPSSYGNFLSWLSFFSLYILHLNCNMTSHNWHILVNDQGDMLQKHVYIFYSLFDVLLEYLLTFILYKDFVSLDIIFLFLL
jgi:hypothetical protein